MPDAFDTFFARVMQSTDITTQQALARVLGVNRSAITQAKNRDAIPQKWILRLSRVYGLAPDWLEYGRGTPRPAPLAQTFAAAPHGTEHAAVQARPVGVAPGRAAALRPAMPAMPLADLPPAVHMVPKVRARLSAGGGSFEVQAMPVGGQPFAHAWLARKGTPSAMVLMDVVGDSMEPEIRDGDTVLVDRATEDLRYGQVYAVGLEDAVLVKRVMRTPDGLALVSDNPAYSPIRVRGDELEQFRVIGRVVWLCRELG
ncbi:S24 family peptidase [Nitratidesulfovibrio liaohensis]|uniref:Helix-turn-helix domain-containing protein n=1 Tax=Nitratidesulfovibrio liaohensis TaxID=2604158 RepID=A0ABY9R3N5_9BACT|nr:S24 family peptidase [Nitratidesulfovibrio liaohensis]WMW65926.1 helix-turn-helix domain-containing protein [Nitratidesulfovibrio liaohensis]